MVQTAENCGVSAVAVHDGCRYSCRGAEAVSHGLAIQQTIEILLLILNTVIDVPVAHVVQVRLFLAVICSEFARGVHDYGLFWKLTSTGAVLGQGGMPVVVPSGAFSQTAQKTADFLQLPFIAGRRHPCHGAEADSHGFACSEDHRDSAAQYFSWWSMLLLCRSCLLCPLLFRQARVV